jgi:hypothetical protein
VHVTNGAKLGFRLSEFDAVLTAYCVHLYMPDHASEDYLQQLETFPGVKLLTAQDEYVRTDVLRAAIKRLGFHAVLTCVPPESVSFVYPPEFSRGAEFTTVLTGYAPEEIPQGRKSLPLAQRPIVIGYRGGHIDGRYGRLGFDKFEIGRRMREVCEARGIPCDIEWSIDKHIFGRAWYDFLASCRVILGSESGCNVFDFDGTIERAHRELSRGRGFVPYQEFRQFTDPREHEVNMGQISPRVFETAAVGTPMILFEGRYSGVIEPWKHYIPLAKDFSNVEDVLSKINDFEFLTALASRARDYLISSQKFGYRAFVRQVDNILNRFQTKLGTAPRNRSEIIVSHPWKLASEKEYPTDCPRSFDYHLFLGERERRIQAEQLALQAQRSTNIVQILMPQQSIRWRLAHTLWRLLPASVRYRIADVLLRSEPPSAPTSLGT